ncbi:MAG: MFS transporter [Dehalococcoidia bacterium]|nr:MFS transporter [Dehalococcoidia bacterium]
MVQSSQVVRQESYLSLMLASLRYRDFRLVWLGSFTEHFGEFMEIATILWLTNELTHSPLMLTIVGSSRYMAMVFMPMVSGVVADRVNRRSMLIVALLGSAVLSVILAILTLTGLIAVWHLIAISLVSGVAMSFNHPARQAIVPNLIKREHLLNAVSLDFISVHVSLFISMLMVGFLILLLGTGPIFIIRVAGCILAIVWLMMARIPPTPAATKKRAPWQSLTEGFSYLRVNPILVGFIALYLLPRLVATTYSNFTPVFANDILRVGAVGYGYLQAAPGLGAILSLIGLTVLTYYKRKVTLLVFAGLIMGVGLIAFTFSPWLYPSLVLLVIVGGAEIAFSTVNSTLIQAAIPDEVRGRIMSWREVAFGLGPVASIAFGAVAQYTGVPTSVEILGGVCLIVSVVLIIFLPGFRRIE